MIDEDDARTIARDALEGVVTLEQHNPVTVEREGDTYVVTFPRENPPGVRGPDFEAQVTVDRRSGEVLEVLAGS
jgi:hypothetical protein